MMVWLPDREEIAWPGCNNTDNNGNLIKQETFIPNNEQNTSSTSWYQQYNYDNLNRLQSVQEYTGNTSLWRQEYVYDRYGNRRIEQDVTKTYGNGINKKDFTVNTANNRLGVPGGQTGVMTYDNAGNLSNDTYTGAGTRTYDAENRMTTAWGGNNQSQVYTYNADGQRTRRKVDGVETWQVYGIGGELLAEYAMNASASSPQKEYGYRNGQLLITATSGSGGSFVFTDNPLVAGSTIIKAVHLTELRDAVNQARATAGLGAAAWTDAPLQGVTIKAVHILELRTRLDEARIALGMSAASYTDPGLAIGYTVKAAHVQELRTRVAETLGASTIQWLVTDQLGTPRMIFDTTGALANVKRHDYLPFGEELYAGQGARTTAIGYGAADGVRQKFTHKERDNETGLDYFGARYYASTQGRFTSADDFLNDTHVDAPASWNLYVYVRNNPLKYVDPAGQEVYSTNLTDEQKKKLIEDWQKKTGYQNVYFDKNNKLVIDTKAGFQGGSAKARDQLSAAVDSTDIRFNLKSVDTTKVAFAEVDAGITIENSQGKTIRTDYTVSIDFEDFKRAGGDDSAKEAYSVGITAIHEFDHKLYNISDYPNGPTDPGSLERSYINPIRQELGLPQRVFYTSRPVDAAFKNFYPGGGQQLNFQFNGKAKVIRWRNDLVGGKVKD